MRCACTSHALWRHTATRAVRVVCWLLVLTASCSVVAAQRKMREGKESSRAQRTVLSEKIKEARDTINEIRYAPPPFVVAYTALALQLTVGVVPLPPSATRTVVLAPT